MAGAIYFAASSPHFVLNFYRNLSRATGKKNYLKDRDIRFDNAFYYLKRKGYLDIQKRNRQIYISLTREGRKMAGKYSIDDLEIRKPKKWDGKYRILIFDIPNNFRIKRDALRGKLKELGFYRLQQSVWVCPHECEKEINLLREFFGLTTRELILITGGIENDKFLQKLFSIN